MIDFSQYFYSSESDTEKILNRIKLSLRIKTTAFDEEIKDLMIAAISDMSLIGIDCFHWENPLILNAIITYVKMNFGEPSDYNRLKVSYDEQKAQLKISEEFRSRGEWNGQI